MSQGRSLAEIFIGMMRTQDGSPCQDQELQSSLSTALKMATVPAGYTTRWCY